MIERASSWLISGRTDNHSFPTGKVDLGPPCLISASRCKSSHHRNTWPSSMHSISIPLKCILGFALFPDQFLCAVLACFASSASLASFCLSRNKYTLASYGICFTTTSLPAEVVLVSYLCRFKLTRDSHHVCKASWQSESVEPVSLRLTLMRLPVSFRCPLSEVEIDQSEAFTSSAFWHCYQRRSRSFILSSR
jgi:hypothetical protein